MDESLLLSDSIDLAVHRLKSNILSLFDGFNHLAQAGQPLSNKFVREIGHYFETGNCDAESANNKACPNPTLLDPFTGDWRVHPAACPFDGYLHLPLKELHETAPDDKQHGMVLKFCQMELKKLLVDFRKRTPDVKFSFYSCDALEFCYQDSPLKFDVIASSDLSDVIGLANVLNAATRKLRSNRSILVTDTLLWTSVAPTVSQYLQVVLCCPLTLIPTIYGVRLVDNIELGPETPPTFASQIMLPTRIRWKTSLSLEGAPLVLSPTLERALKQLKDECFHLSQPDAFVTKTTGRCGMARYSPLTFSFVLGDMIRRGGFRNPAALMSSVSFRLPPVFSKSLETNQAWMNDDPVWRVTVFLPYDSIQEAGKFAFFKLPQSPIDPIQVLC